MFLKRDEYVPGEKIDIHLSQSPQHELHATRQDGFSRSHSLSMRMIERVILVMTKKELGPHEGVDRERDELEDDTGKHSMRSLYSDWMSQRNCEVRKKWLMNLIRKSRRRTGLGSLPLLTAFAAIPPPSV